MFGHGVDIDSLHASREALIKHIKETTNRHELEFGELSWISEWRPNIRMADKFGEGRAFIIGGKYLDTKRALPSTYRP